MEKFIKKKKRMNKKHKNQIVGNGKFSAFNSGLLRSARNDGTALIYNLVNLENLNKIVVQDKNNHNNHINHTNQSSDK